MNMKKILISFALLFGTLNVGAQKMQETVYLKNGSIIKGTIVEQVPNESLKIRTADGSLFVYQMSEVTKITKEEEVKPAKKVVIGDGKHRGLDFSIIAGYHIGVGDFEGGSIPSVEFGLGKQINKNLYFGLGSGLWIPTQSGADPSIPITADSKVMFPLTTSNIVPMGSVRLGYMTSSGGEGSGVIMMQLMPGIEMPISKTTDFLLAAGYTHSFSTEGGGGGGYFSLKAGFNFHKNQSLKPRPKRPKSPIRTKGFQLTLEGAPAFTGSGEFGWLGNVAFTYKLNPYLSAGIGLGYESLSVQSDGEMQFIEGGKEDRDELDELGTAESFKGFLRGTYRMSKRKFSPIISVDAGIRLYLTNDGYYQEWALNQFEKDAIGGFEDKALFVAPSIGFSLRTTNNTYLELKAGYEFAQPNECKKGQKNGLYYYFPSINTNATFVTLGFTHTFGKRPARPPRPE